MKKMIFSLALSFFSGNVLAAGTCVGESGSYGYERAVEIGRTTTYFRPFARLGRSDNARLVLVDYKETAVGFCKAMGHTNGAIGSKERSDEIPYTFAINSDGEVQGIYTACREDCGFVVNTVTCENE